MSHGRDEIQILIIGRTIEGLALAGFLRQAGLEPIIINRPDHQPRPPICTLPPDTVERFQKLGIAKHLCEVGHLIQEWTVHHLSGEQTQSQPTGCIPPVVLRRSVVRDRLQRPIPDAAIRSVAPVKTLSTTDTYARIGFEDGIEESFDLIIGADAPCSVVRTQLTDDAVIPSERSILSVEATTEQLGAGITEFHRPDSLTICVKTGDTTRIQASSPHVEDTTTEHTADSPPSWLLPDQLDDVTIHSIDQAHYDRVAGETWTAGRGVLLGPAAAALPALTGIGLALAIADAHAFADTLSSTSGTIDSQLQAYAADRHALRNAIADQLPGPTDTTSRAPVQCTQPNDLAFRKLFHAACLDPPAVFAT